MGDVSDPLQGAVSEAEDFNRLETTTPDVRPRLVFGGFFLRKEKKELILELQQTQVEIM